MIAMDTSWESICSNPLLKDLPYKIETNRHNQIVMSPSYLWHGDFQASIASLLKEMMTGGRVLAECPVETSDGTKVADVAWISRDRYLPYRQASSLPVAPEICVEIISTSNTRAEMTGKRTLYFERGAREVWFCDADGTLEFFVKDSASPCKVSAMCPSFPKSIAWE